MIWSHDVHLSLNLNRLVQSHLPQIQETIISAYACQVLIYFHRKPFCHVNKTVRKGKNNNNKQRKQMEL